MNDYMEILVKETIMLHKVLTRYLVVPTVEVRHAPLELQGSL